MNSYIFDVFLPVMAAFFSSVILGKFAIPALARLKASQTEREEGLASHKKKQGTPTMGGVIFLIPFLVISLFFARTHKEVIPVLILTFGFGIIGFLDDYIKVVLKRNLGLRAWQKIVGQFVITVIFALYMMNGEGLQGLSMYVPFMGGKTIDFGILNIPVLFFIALGTANGTNFTDGVDGLCATVTTIVAAFFGFAAIKLAVPGACFISCAFAGALLGYLVYNVYPGKVMMGDTGSLAIGGFVTGVAYVLQMPIFIAIIGFIYMIEVISVIMQVSYFKATHGKRIFKMAPIHHHFELCGWSETRVVYIFSAVTVICGLVAFAGLNW